MIALSLPLVKRICQRVLPAIAMVAVVFTAMPASSANAASGNKLSASDQAKIEKFVINLATETIAKVNDETATGVQRRDALADILTKYGTVAETAQFSLGRYARKLDEDAREGFFEIAKHFAANTMYQYLKGIPKIEIKVTKIVERGKKNNQFVVFTKVYVPAQNRSLDIDWWVVNKKQSGTNQLKLFDFAFEGVWLAQSQRSVFVSLLKKNRGDFGELYKYIRQVIAKAAESIQDDSADRRIVANQPTLDG